MLNQNNKNSQKDHWNVIFLTFIYFLQCVPLGLIGSLPYILSSRSVSYAEQGDYFYIIINIMPKYAFAMDYIL